MGVADTYRGGLWVPEGEGWFCRFDGQVWMHTTLQGRTDPEIRRPGYDWFICLGELAEHPHVGPFPTLAAAKAAFRLLYLEQEP